MSLNLQNNQITHRDIEIISDKIGLNIQATKTLLEEETDINLIISQIFNKFSESEIKDLSFSLKIKVLLFQKTSLKDFSFKEKIDVCNTIINYLPSLIDRPSNLIINYDWNKEVASKNFVLCGFFKREALTPHWVTILRGFEKDNKTSIFRHLNDWVDIMKEINKDLKCVNIDDEKSIEVISSSVSSFIADGM
jgi:hypothetical protein